ncbi:hypothetical protein M9H77_23915 [Catharanthus roseus]|uniref:Uncharacterized protein n=1 Tax=Catharanthus roseus TaxID=4058 RepID=A0ACC0AX61_CATRO|nr:hypothetical protein M9H77_23915 [Catharanthus roseus]
MPYRALFRIFCGNWLPTTNVILVLKERAHLLYAFATKKKINIYTVIFKNILRQIGQKKRSFYTSYSWVKALDPLVMKKSTTPGVMPPFPTPSTQGHTGPGRSTRQ